MNIQPITKGPFNYIVIDDVYSDLEVEVLKKEIKDLKWFSQNPEETGTANDDTGILKTGRGIFIDDHFANNRNASVILRLNRIIFDERILKASEEFNYFFNHIRRCTQDGTLVNFYENGEVYKPHRDFAMITAVTFFSIGDITGGDLSFDEFDEVVEFKENRMVIFPGCALHTAHEVHAEPGNYRVSIAQFLGYKQ